MGHQLHAFDRALLSQLQGSRTLRHYPPPSHNGDVAQPLAPAARAHPCVCFLYDALHCAQEGVQPRSLLGAFNPLFVIVAKVSTGWRVDIVAKCGVVESEDALWGVRERKEAGGLLEGYRTEEWLRKRHEGSSQWTGTSSESDVRPPSTFGGVVIPQTPPKRRTLACAYSAC